MRRTTAALVICAILMAAWCLNAVFASPRGAPDEILNTYPEIEPNDSCATAQSATCDNEIRPAAIEPVLDEDFYFLISTAGNLVTVGTDYESPGAPETDTVIDLFADDCTTLLAHDDDSGAGRFALISAFIAPYSGNYVVRVSGQNASVAGPYRAYVSCRYTSQPPDNDDCEHAIALLRCAEQTLTGTTAHAYNDYDPGTGGCTGRAETGRDVVYSVELQPADTLNVLYRQTQADGALYLLTDCGNPAGSCIAGSDQDPSGGYEAITYVAPAAGTYYLVLDSFGDDTGGPWMLQYRVGCAAPATGACVMPDCTCQLLTRAECSGLGGAWSGAGTSCDAPAARAHVLTPDAGGPRLLYAPTADDDLEYRAAMAAQIGGICDYYDASVGTPSIELLHGYDCVMTWGFGYLDSLAFGNNLADFVDGGGHVVLGLFTLTGTSPPSIRLGGRIVSDPAYCPVTGDRIHSTASSWDGSDGGSCLHAGIFCYGTHWHSILTLRPGATVVGRFQDGEIANAVNATQTVFFANGAGPLTSTGQDAQRVANACLCGAPTRVESSTWGALKALYR